MKAFAFAVFCAFIIAASGSGVAIIPATAHGGAIAGHGGAAAIIAGPAGVLGPAGILGAGAGLLGVGPAGIVAPGLAGYGLLGNLGHGLIGSGIEGQYVPSGRELLYDDGSYRPEHHFAGHGHGLLYR